MRVREVAVRLDVSQATVYALLASGKLRHCRIGNGRGVVRVSEEQFQEYLKAAESKPVGDRPTAPLRRPTLKHLRLN